MAVRYSKAAQRILDSLLPLPFDDAHWEAVFEVMRLSPRQSEIVALILRDATTKQIEVVLGIKVTTIKQQRERIAARTGTRRKMELAMKVLVISHQVWERGARALNNDKSPRDACGPNGRQLNGRRPKSRLSTSGSVE